MFIGANIAHHAQLRIKNECDAMREAFKSCFGEDSWRRRVEFKADCFANPASFMEDVMRFEPSILHFSCHGDVRGLWLSGSQSVVESGCIVDALAAHNKEVESGCQIQLVIVNLCMSGPLASALSGCVDFVIGHGKREVGDIEAMSFSKTLLKALGRGRSLDGSFKAAKVASSPFRLYAHRFNPEELFLPVPALPLLTSENVPSLVQNGQAATDEWRE